MAADVEEASTLSQPPPAKRQRRTDGGPCGLEKKHKVFLSHSGADKAFVSHLCRRLISVHHYPFFDEREDSLPLGDKFADIIFQASKQCQLAIVVVSDDYFKSKWPMLELASFVEAKDGVNPEMKILPLFYKLTVAQFKEPEQQRVWFERWVRLKESDERLDILSWKDALRVLGGHSGAVYCGTGQTEDEYIESIVQSVFRLVPPDVLYDDSHVKGGTHLCEDIDALFEKSRESRSTGRVQCPIVGIYGLGGIGKTNLCQIAYNKFVGEFSGRACLIEIGSKTKSCLESQREVLRALTGAHDDLLNSITDIDKGRRLYKERVGSHRVFLAIDNVWDDSGLLGEADAYLVHELHLESKVLVTARCKKTLTNLGIKEECCFEMPDLREEDAMGLFLHNACPTLPPIEVSNPEHLKVVKECISNARYSKNGDTVYHFHPLALKVLGLFMKTLTPFPSKWIEKLNNPKILGSKVKDVYLVLRTSFDMLPEDDHRAMFLDVAIYAPKGYYYEYNSPTVEEVCEWLSIVYVQEIEVVKDKLEVLSARGLLNHWDDFTNSISMHDLYFDFAEAEVKRDDTQQGRAHLYHKQENNMPQCLTRNPKGAKSFSFQRMRFSNVCNLDSFKKAKLDKCANVEVLTVDYCYGLQSLDINGLEELCSLELLECPTLEHLQGLENRDKLVWMRWDPCYAKVVDYTLLTSLRVLQLTKVSHSTTLDLRNCNNLQELAIRYSYGLKDFPLFPNSKSMSKICFAYCENLRHCGPEVLNLEGWIDVEFLDLACCKSLTNELESCPTMGNLKHLDISSCYNLNALPNLIKSKNLISFKVTYCEKLLQSYASSREFGDSMGMGLHFGLNTSRVSLGAELVASRILTTGFFSQEAQQSLIDSLRVHNFEGFESQYAMEYLKARGVKWNRYFNPKYNIHDLFCEINNMADKPIQREVKEVHNLDILECFSQWCHSKEFDGKRSQLTLVEGKYCGHMHLDFVFSSSLRVLVLTGLVDHFFSSPITFDLRDCHCLLELELRDILRLERFPLFPKAKNLRKICFHGCANLRRRAPEVLNLEGWIDVEFLDLACCKSLTNELESCPTMKKLQRLDVSYCKSLIHLPNLLESKNLICLNVSYCDELVRFYAVSRKFRDSMGMDLHFGRKTSRVSLGAELVASRILKSGVFSQEAQQSLIDSLTVHNFEGIESQYAMEYLKARGVKWNRYFNPKYNIHDLFYEINNMADKPIQREVKEVHNLDILEYFSQRCHSKELDGKRSQPALAQGECCGQILEDFVFSSSLRVLELTGLVDHFFSSAITFDLRNCHCLLELELRDILRLERFPLFPKAKNLRKICFHGCANLRHRAPEVLNLEGWIDVEFLDLACCKSLTNELENCPTMKNLKRLDISYCENLIRLPNLLESKNLISLNVSHCDELVRFYAVSKEYGDSMGMDVHFGLNTSGFLVGPDLIASRILKTGVFSQEAQQSLIDSLRVHNFEGFESQYAMEYLKARGVKWNRYFNPTYNIHDLFCEINNRADKPIQREVKEIHNLDILEYFSQQCHSKEFDGKRSQPALAQREYCGHILEDFVFPSSLRVLELTGLVDHFFSSPIIFDLRNCHCLLELELRDILRLERFPLFPKAKNLRKICFHGCANLRHRAPEVLNLEGWIDVEFLDLACCKSLTNELENCPTMKKLQRLDVSYCENLIRLPNLLESKNLISLNVSYCDELVRFYAVSRKFRDSMSMDVHFGLNTSRVSLGAELVASRILNTGVFSQEAQQSLIESLRVHNFNGFESQYAMEYLKARGVKWNRYFNPKYNIHDLFYEINNMADKPIQREVKEVHNLDILEYFSQRCHSKEFDGKRSQPVLAQGECCGQILEDFVFSSSLRVLELTGLVDHFFSSAITFDLRNCHCLLELELRDLLRLERFPLFPEAKNLRKICFHGCANLRHRAPEVLNLEGWIDVEFLDLACCKSLTNELESCPTMKNLKRLDVSDCKNLIRLPNLLESKNLISLNVSHCDELVRFYAFSKEYGDSMALDLHFGLNTSGFSVGAQLVASRMLKTGVFSQEAQQSLIDSLRVHNFKGIESQYAMEYLKARGVKWNWVFKSKFNIHDLFCEINNMAEKPSEQEVKEVHNLDILEYFSQWCHSKGFDGKQSQPALGQGEYCGYMLEDFVFSSSLRVLELTGLVDHFFSSAITFDLRNCHCLLELELRDILRLERFPLFPEAKSLRKICFHGCANLRHRAPEVLNLEGWIDVEFLDLACCKSLTNELENCPTMKKLQRLDVSYCENLIRLPNLLESKNLISLNVSYCDELVRFYAVSRKFRDSMCMDPLFGLNISRVSLGAQLVASRILKTGVFSQEAQQSLIDSLRVHKFKGIESQYYASIELFQEWQAHLGY